MSAAPQPAAAATDPESLRQRFARDGYVSPLPCIAPQEAAALVARMDAFAQARPQDVRWAFDIKCSLLFDWVYRAAAEPRLLDLVEPLLGPDLLLTNAIFRTKEPGGSVGYGWHQDAARVPVEPCFVIAFLALTDCSPENGGLAVIPGTHHGVAPFALTSTSAGQQRRTVARVIDPPVARAVDVVLRAGEVCLFSGNCVHGSQPNRSKHRRVAMLFDYTAAQARQAVGQGSGQLVRGTDAWGHFGREPVPQGECLPQDAAARRDILRHYPENPLLGPREPGTPVTFPDDPRFEAMQA